MDLLIFSTYIFVFGSIFSGAALLSVIIAGKRKERSKCKCLIKNLNRKNMS